MSRSGEFPYPLLHNLIKRNKLIHQFSIEEFVSFCAFLANGEKKNGAGRSSKWVQEALTERQAEFVMSCRDCPTG